MRIILSRDFRKLSTRKYSNPEYGRLEVLIVSLKSLIVLGCKLLSKGFWNTNQLWFQKNVP